MDSYLQLNGWLDGYGRLRYGYGYGREEGGGSLCTAGDARRNSFLGGKGKERAKNKKIMILV